MNSLKEIAEKIAKENNLNVDALLDENEKIFYFLNNDSVIEVERKTHLSRCIKVSNNTYKLIEALQILNKYLKV